jgi:plasmid maintenance system antidote protein VapI
MTRALHYPVRVTPALEVARLRAGLSKNALAQRLGCTPQTIAALESGCQAITFEWVCVWLSETGMAWTDFLVLLEKT